MDAFSVFVTKVGDGTKFAIKKSTELVEMTKLNFSISGEEMKVQKKLEEIGKIIYSEYNQGHQVSNDILSLCEDIDDTEAKIRMYTRKINALKNNNFCRKCGAVIDRQTGKCINCDK